MASNWRRRARKVENLTPTSAKSDWRSRAVKVEERRAVNKVEGEDIRGNLADRASDFFTPPPVEDVAVSAAQGITGGFADEIAGGLVGAWKKSSGDDRPYEEIYKEIRDSIRDKTYEARERSPLTSFIAENIGAAVNPVMRGGGLMKSVAQGAIIGAGESEKDSLVGLGLESAVTGTLGGALHGATNLATAGFSKPSNIRTRYLGAKAKEYEKRGVLGDPRETSNFLKKHRFFKYKDSVFDFSEGLFKKSKGSKGLPTREDSLNNAHKGIAAIGDKVSTILKANNKKFYGSDMATHGSLTQRLDDIINRAKDSKKASKIVDEEMGILQHSLDNPSEAHNAFGEIEVNPEGVNLARINQIKSNYQREAKKNFEALDPVFKEKAEVETAIATALKEFIEDNAGSKSAEIKKLNTISHQLRNALKGLSPSTAKADASGTTIRGINPFMNLPSQAARGVGDVIGGGETGMLMRASVGENVGKAVDKIPDMLRRPMETAIRTEPSRMAAESLSGRSPDSVDDGSGGVNFMVADTDIPRSTDFVVEHPKLFVAKVMQAAGPEWAMKFQTAISKDDKRTLQTTLPLFAQQYPEIFETDEHNVFDNKIIDPNDRQRYSESVYMRDDISDYEKAEMLNHLNKYNEVLK